MKALHVARAVEVIFFALCCAIAAEFAATWFGRAGLENAPLVDIPAPDGAERTWSDRQVIVERNLFQVAMAGPAEAVGEPPPEEESSPVATRLPLRLLGTAASGGAGEAWAAVEDQRTRRLRVVRAGETLLDAATLVRVERRRIVIQNGASRETLALDGEEELRLQARTAVTNPSPESAAVAMAQRLQQLSETSFAKEPKPAPVDANPRNQTQIAPRVENGQVTGVQLSEIERGSVFDALGIREGDVVTQANGIVATNHQDSIALLRELTEASDLEVNVIGTDGAARTLSRSLGN